MEEQVPRPQPVAGLFDRVREWVGWFGMARLIAAAIAMTVVCLGAIWLVRTPPPTSEAGLPSVLAAGAPSSTLPPPGPGTSAPPNPMADDSTTITVHVAGAVQRPGVYQVGATARVHMAIAAAGGVSADADPDALNLAAAVVDGSRIYVPEVGEEVVPISGGDAVGDTVPSGPIDVNRATADDLDTLPGVGPATAAAIVTERERNGPFLTVDDLERVPGIGPAKLASIRDLVTA